NSYTQPMLFKFSSLEFPIPDAASPDQILKIKKTSEAALSDLKNGKDITNVANAYHGVLVNHEPTALNEIPAEWQKTISQLTKPNDISELLQSGKSFVILKISGIEEPKIQSFATVKDKVK